MEFRMNNGTNFYEDADDCYLRRLSLYATVRPEDLAALKGRSLRQKKARNTLQSLQNLFQGVQSSHSFVPDLRTALVEESDERTSSTSSESLEDAREVVVNGGDIQDLPIEYTVDGLKSYELPVIGFYIDERVTPGFTYRVRYVGGHDYVFDGKPRLLQSIGMGYGKRLTFRGDTMNQNDAYFWSDSHPEGFAFSVRAVSQGDKFSIYNAMNSLVGELKVTKVDEAQVEKSTECANGSVKKLVHVSFTCEVNLFHRHHNSLMDVDDNNNVQFLDGIAEVVKPKGSRQAALVKITDVNLPRIGSCSLWKEE